MFVQWRRQNIYVYTVSRKKRGRQHFGHNFDKFKYIVGNFFSKKYYEGNAKLLTQQQSPLPNQCRYFSLWIRQWPCIAKRKVIYSILTTAIKPNRAGCLRANVPLINDSKKGRRSLKTQCLNQDSARNDRRPVGLDAPWETRQRRHCWRSDAQKLQWRRDPALSVLMWRLSSSRSVVHVFYTLSCSIPHTL